MQDAGNRASTQKKVLETPIMIRITQKITYAISIHIMIFYIRKYAGKLSEEFCMIHLQRSGNTEQVRKESNRDIVKSIFTYYENDWK